MRSVAVISATALVLAGCYSSGRWQRGELHEAWRVLEHGETVTLGLSGNERASKVTGSLLEHSTEDITLEIGGGEKFVVPMSQVLYLEQQEELDHLAMLGYLVLTVVTFIGLLIFWAVMERQGRDAPRRAGE